MNRSIIPSAVLGGTVTATLFGLFTTLSPNAGVEASLDGMLDLPAKHYAAEVLLGASDGMKETGWSNIGIEERLSAVKGATHPNLRKMMRDVYDQAYEQGLTGEWTEAALDGYLEVVEMPGRHIYHVNAATLEGDEALNPSALHAKIVSDYGERWDEVGTHFREGLEGIILTTVTSTQLGSMHMTEQELSVKDMQVPMRRAVDAFAFMTHGPNEPRITTGNEQREEINAHREKLNVDPQDEANKREPVDTAMRQRVDVKLERPRIPVTWDVMSGKLSIDNPFAVQPATQKTVKDEPDL